MSRPSTALAEPESRETVARTSGSFANQNGFQRQEAGISPLSEIRKELSALFVQHQYATMKVLENHFQKSSITNGDVTGPHSSTHDQEVCAGSEHVRASKKKHSIPTLNSSEDDLINGESCEKPSKLKPSLGKSSSSIGSTRKSAFSTLDRRTVVDTLGKTESTKRTENQVQRLVSTPCFDYFFGLCIVLNSALIGWDADFEARRMGHVDDYSKRHLARASLFFFIIFTIELVLRFAAHRSQFFLSERDQWWNMFDTTMVATLWVELILKSQIQEEGSMKSPLTRLIRVLRVARVTRVLRLGRLMRYAAPFRKIAFAMRATLGTLFWVFLMMLLVIYCFAVVIVEGSTETIYENVELIDGRPILNSSYVSADVQLLSRHYGTLLDAMYSLFKSCTSGQSWGELVDPLLAENEVVAGVFLLFIFVATFGVLNVVTAVFVESALQAQQFYKEMLIHDNVVKKQAYIAHLQTVFREIDVDNSGGITADELEQLLSSPEYNLYFESMDIYPNDARALFRLLDTESDGIISIEEFCEGCLKLKGEAKSYDVQCLIYNSERVLKQLTNQIAQLQHDLGYIPVPNRRSQASNLSQTRTDNLVNLHHVGAISTPSSGTTAADVKAVACRQVPQEKARPMILGLKIESISPMQGTCCIDAKAAK